MATSQVPESVLLDGSQMALSGLVAGTVGYLKKQQMDPAEWVKHIGEMFEDAMGAMEGEGADTVMSHLLVLSILPMGGKVISQQMTADKAEVEISSLPPEEVLARFGAEPDDLLDGFGITADEFAVIYDMQRPALEAIGLTFTHGPGKEGYVLTLAR